MTAEEAERERADWFRLGWQEHARLEAGGSGQAPPPQAPRLRLADHEGATGANEHDRATDATRPDREGRVEGGNARDEDGAGHADGDGGRDEFPLPVVGAAEAEVRELMPHRLRARGRYRP
ncbi:hypothetical protein [Streptomyces sp. NPDC102360]|uniref:hypothetical protein n=1 Tax=Streptomyces sp. NPDC102360 TaxID=3366160 RepID=UPI00381CEC43